ncbi:MAG TPA: C10 family peptidase, partial [Bacteroidia bacterium]
MKKIFTILTMLFFVHVLFAKPVDEETAKRVGSNFLRFKTQVAFTGGDQSLSLIYKSASKAKTPNSSTTPLNYFYVFNIGTQGFIMVSADDNAQAIIGYSNQGTFKPNEIPQSVAKWMEGYKEQIRTIIEKKMEASELIKKEWLSLSLGTVEAKAGKRASVNPLMSTTWNQSPYYNASCPGSSVTGCVATAMAQIMKYWSYPTTGTGFHSYNHNTYGTLSANFGSTTYQWSSMPNNVSSSNSAVA